MVSAGSYILSALALAAVGLSIGFSAHRLRQRLLPTWLDAPARLVEAVVAIALLIWLGELLGTFSLLYESTLVVASLLLAGAVVWFVRPLSPDEPPLSAGGAAGGTTAEEASATGGGGGSPAATGPAGPTTFALFITWAVIALVFAHWGITTKNALDRGIFNFDSLWYHLPFAADMVQSHSTTGLHYVDTVFTNWFYPQNAELLHATGILLVHRDTLSLFANFGFLGIAFLAAWCIGRPYGRGHLTVVAAAVVLECHTLVVREPGAAKNDLVAAALLLAATAILVNAWEAHRAQGGPKVSLPVGWPLAVAGLAVGLAVGTKSTGVAMAAGLTLAVLVLAPAGKRLAAAGWWLVPALLGGGYWYLRNLIVAGNPLPQATSLGPISLPHPERLQEGRPDFNVVHYLTDVDVWREYFAPGLHQAFGGLWPLVIAAAAAGGLLALLLARERVLRWIGAVALLGMVAYLFTPLSAAGAEGEPIGFGINIRYAIPPLLLGITLLPLALPFTADGPISAVYQRKSARRQWVWEWGLLATLLLMLVVTDRADAVLRDPARTFGVPLALFVVLVPGALLLARSRGARPALVASGFAALALAVVAVGYPLERHYLRDRFGPGSEIPGMHMEAAYRWARDKGDARIGIAGTTAGFLQYGLYGTDLSNRVIYLGEKGPHGAFDAIPTCSRFRAAVNAADLEYLVTSPFLNFIHTDEPILSPESRWLRDDPAAKPLFRSGPVTVWRLEGRLDPAGCGPRNAPLQRVPDTPS